MVIYMVQMHIKKHLTGEYKGIEIKLVSCDYTDFKLVEI